MLTILSRGFYCPYTFLCMYFVEKCENGLKSWDKVLGTVWASPTEKCWPSVTKEFEKSPQPAQFWSMPSTWTTSIPATSRNMLGWCFFHLKVCRKYHLRLWITYSASYSSLATHWLQGQLIQPGIAIHYRQFLENRIQSIHGNCGIAS